MLDFIMRIAVAGHLGNQLFQWGFGHWLQTQKGGAAVPFIMQEMNIPTNGWKCQLNFLTANCNHFQIHKPIQSDFYRDKFAGKSQLLLQVLPFGDNLISFSDTFFGIRRESFHDRRAERVPKRILYQGYFQNISHFRKFIPTLTTELNHAIMRVIQGLGNSNGELNRINEIIKSNPIFQLVHVRRGDFLYAENRGFGLLGADYYLVHKGTLPIVVITDDVEGAKDVIRQLEPIAVVNPIELDAIATLYLFTKAHVIVSSNSTFSYWGSLLALGAGKRVIIPSKFRPFEEDLWRFYVDGMEISEAKFIF